MPSQGPNTPRQYPSDEPGPSSWARVAAETRPLAYLWVFDPVDSSIYLEDEQGPHPADFPMFSTMAQHVTHPDRRQGYAYSIIGGWRITDDYDGKVSDPVVLKCLSEALRAKHPPSTPSGC